MKTLSYCGEEVRRHDRDRFLLALFATGAAREALFAVYALNIELENIRRVVSEEMLGHVRHAWWHEAIDALYVGVPPRAQPVLQALAPLIQSGALPRAALFPLLDGYRAQFPNLPPDVDTQLETISIALLSAMEPERVSSWRRAHRIMTQHRKHYEARKYPWMILKLLLAGVPAQAHAAWAWLRQVRSHRLPA